MVHEGRSPLSGVATTWVSTPRPLPGHDPQFHDGLPSEAWLFSASQRSAPRFLLDTSTLSLAMRPEADANVVRMLREHIGVCAMASLSLGELRYGLDRMPDGRRRRELVAFLDQVLLPMIPTLSYDEAAALWHAGERARLARLGKPPPFVDGQIAAVAFTNGLSVVTANTRDFAVFEGLVVDNWATRWSG